MDDSAEALRRENTTLSHEIDVLQERVAALREQVATMSRANAALEQFAWAASHDLKEPLRTIRAYAQLLLRRRPPEEGSEEAEFAAFLEQGIERLQAMVEGLLAYARAGARDEELQQASDTSAIAADVVESLHGLMEECGAGIELAPLPAVAAEQTPVFQILSNLIGNALKYRAAGVTPCIQVFAAEDAGQMIQFGVRDNGIGIHPQYAELIFEPFERLNGDEYPGIGLGLALSKRLVASYGGRIWVESELGAGSTFYFTLPAAQALACETPEPQAKACATSGTP
jgi:signal transduction histidine kinase